MNGKTGAGSQCGFRYMVDRLVRGRDLEVVLHTRKDAAAFHAAIGFAPATDAMIRGNRR